MPNNRQQDFRMAFQSRRASVVFYSNISTSSFLSHLLLLALFLTSMTGCGDAETNTQASEQRAAKTALRDLGAGVKELDDDSIAAGGIVAVTLFEEHLTRDGLITDEVLSHVKRLRKCLLRLDNTRVADAALGQLTEIGSLIALSLHNTKVSDAGLKHLRAMSDFRLLKLNNTSITDDGLANLQGLTGLRVLYVSHSQLTDAGLKHVREMTNLKALQISGTQISDAGLEHLKRLTALEYLGLDDNEISDTGLENLKGLTRLKYLNLKGTRVTGRTVREFQRSLPNCQIVR